MTEEQFWKSNPKIISIYGDAWKEEQNRQNTLAHMYTGNYILSALYTAIDGVINGRKAVAKYMSKPVQLFELTEEEKADAQATAINQFVAWANGTQKKYSKKGG